MTLYPYISGYISLHKDNAVANQSIELFRFYTNLACQSSGYSQPLGHLTVRKMRLVDHTKCRFNLASWIYLTYSGTIFPIAIQGGWIEDL